MGGRGSKSSRGGAGAAEPAGPSKEVQEKLAQVTPAQQKTYNTIAGYGDTGTTSRVAGINAPSLGPLLKAGLIRDTGRRAEPPGWKRSRERFGMPARTMPVYVAVK